MGLRRALVSFCAFVSFCALGAAGCDAGGLLIAETTVGPDAGPVVHGPSVTELVNAGTVASNDKYKLVYTLGQPTPNQGPGTSTNNRDNGGIVGAMNGK